MFELGNIKDKIRSHRAKITAKSGSVMIVTQDTKHYTFPFIKTNTIPFHCTSLPTFSEM